MGGVSSIQFLGGIYFYFLNCKAPNAAPHGFRVIDAVEIIQDLEYTVNETKSVIGRAAYYALCLDIILDTGKGR